MKWIKCSDEMPEMENEEMTVEVLMHFGNLSQTGNFYFDETGTGSFYHVFFDGECFMHEPTHWAAITPPEDV
jgi:hypothetical protein